MKCEFILYALVAVVVECGVFSVNNTIVHRNTRILHNRVPCSLTCGVVLMADVRDVQITRLYM